MPVINLVNNLDKPGLVSDMYILPEKVIYSNANVWYTGSGLDWTTFDNTQIWDGKQLYAYQHTWGITGVRENQWNDADEGTGYGGTALRSLCFQFPGAVFSVTTGQYYNLRVNVNNAWGYNGDDTATRDVMLVSLSDPWDGTSPECKGFWINGYLIAPSSNIPSASAGQADIEVYAESLDGTQIIPGTLMYPFFDIDQKQSYGGRPEEPDAYVESVIVTDNCSAVYVQTNSWLLVKSPEHPNGEAVVNLAGQSVSYQAKFYNSAGDDPVGYQTGVVCIFDTTGKVQWRGSTCGTSLTGTSLSFHLLEYDGNPDTSIGTVSNVPAPQLKVSEQLINLSTQVPVHSVPTSSAGEHISAEFLYWATSQDGSGEHYNPGAPFNNDAVAKLYAQWKFTHAYDLTYNLVGGYGIKSNQITAGPIVYQVAKGTSVNILNDWRIEKLGNTISGWIEGSTTYATNNVPGGAGIQRAMTVNAKWVATTHTVKFHDGYTSGNDVIKTVTVTHGGSVASGDIPVPGQTYSGRKFAKGGFYRFAGWSGSTTNILDNTDLVAMWEFVPIWVMKNGQWVKYHPTEP